MLAYVLVVTGWYCDVVEDVLIGKVLFEIARSGRVQFLRSREDGASGSFIMIPPEVITSDGNPQTRGDFVIVFWLSIGGLLELALSFAGAHAHGAHGGGCMTLQTTAIWTAVTADSKA